MTGTGAQPTWLSAADLRAEFDHTFTEPPRSTLSEVLDYVLVRVGVTLFALPAAELRGIEDQVQVLSLPSSVPSLMGIAGVRGTITPVYWLGLLLGLEAEPPDQVDRLSFACVSVDVAGEETSIGLAFDQVVAFARVPLADTQAPASPGARSTILHQQTLLEVVPVRSIANQLVTLPNRPGAGPVSGAINLPDSYGAKDGHR